MCFKHASAPKTMGGCGVRCASHLFAVLGFPTLILGLPFTALKPTRKDSDQLQAPFRRFVYGSRSYTSINALYALLWTSVTFYLSFLFYSFLQGGWFKRRSGITCDLFIRRPCRFSWVLTALSESRKRCASYTQESFMQPASGRTLIYR
ncbi:hypothetical protein SCHPADRAFT_18356 [Schizopora paradoxa]|uniref:Uncharacterized protein n=1 Tax=Schizopora paradoxa TaxID=27342 RepID=A0A0H2S8X8_9AGAM|nr:hypothetical protein SCHPADRAFT_18356 [Schizopora paradoxa]